MGSSCRDRVKSIGIFVLTACLICFIRCVWSDDESQSEGSLDEALHPEDRFPAFHHALETAIQDLGGKVIAKLGDTCPTDATWITTECSFACRSADDLYQLLKASQRIPDFVDLKASPELALRRWKVLDQALEFRCFVRNGELIACCQKYDCYFSNYLVENVEKLKEALSGFFKFISSRFPEQTFIYDVAYVSEDKFILIDMAPWSCEKSHPAIFSWDELDSIQSGRLVFKYVESDLECLDKRPKTLSGPVEFENFTDFAIPENL